MWGFLGRWDLWMALLSTGRRLLAASKEGEGVGGGGFWWRRRKEKQLAVLAVVGLQKGGLGEPEEILLPGFVR
ncbi:unnamed protein product [Linum trigynum]|uniref:Secreted protein n=1 Tax=Linum trigynum TaxID=586398 RepID=A0AAV2DJ09_9ROSI